MYYNNCSPVPVKLKYVSWGPFNNYVTLFVCIFQPAPPLSRFIGGKAYEAWRLVPPQNLVEPGGTLWNMPPQNFCN